MGRKKPKQSELFVPHTATQAPGHRFYEKLNELLSSGHFDTFVEDLCAPDYDPDAKKGRVSIPPGTYFRMLLIGYFEGLESERGICWRCEDSLSLRAFLGLNLTDRVPDHSTLSRTRHRFDGDLFSEVFTYILKLVHEAGLLKGKVVGVDSTYLRADASMKAIVRKDTTETHHEYIKRLAEANGEETSTEALRRQDRKRPKKTSNREWGSKTDEDARIARIKDGRTRLAYKSEHVTDLETGAIVSASIYPADAVDTQTLKTSLENARDEILSVIDDDDDNEPPTETPSSKPGLLSCPEIIADKGYYKTSLLVEIEDMGLRPYIAEPHRPRGRSWTNRTSEEQRAAFLNRARLRRAKSKRHHCRRGEYIERGFAHICETGGGRRTRLRGWENVSKSYLLRAAAANLGLIMRSKYGLGTPRGWANALHISMGSLRARWNNFCLCIIRRMTIYPNAIHS